MLQKAIYARADTAILKLFCSKWENSQKFEKEHMYENILLISNTLDSILI